MCAANIHFFSRSLPSLEAGEYQLQVTQSLTGGGLNTGDYFSSPVTQRFKVEGPQVVLGAAEMGPCQPPPNAVGNYSWSLPQIQLNRATLPWERAVGAPEGVPWLALVVLRDDEITWNAALQSPLFPTTVAGLAHAPAQVFVPSLSPDYLAYPADTPVQTMRMRVDVFQAVMPRQAELAMLCHCREVVPDAGNRQGDVPMLFSLVTANRFPTAAGLGRNHCFLVSIEGYYNQLIDTPTFRDGSNQVCAQVQMVVLRYWNFVAMEDAGRGFGSGLSGGTRDASSLLLRVPGGNASPNTTVRDRLNQGYIPAEYDAGAGAPTFAWYRGPLTPVIAQPLPLDGALIVSGDAAMIYSEDEGLFDLSYASAFQMGRAVAMADTDFCMSLLAFRSAAYQAMTLLTQRLLTRDYFNLTPENLQQILASNYIYNTFDLAISQNIVAILGGIAGAQVPTVGSIRHPKPFTSPANMPQRYVNWALTQTEVKAAISEAVAAELLPVGAWLGQLRLLCKLPFHQLVPDQRMLPPDSVRFFYIDQNWLDCLQAGAKSVGIESSQDTFFYQAMKGVIDDAVWQEMQAYALNLSGLATGDKEADAPTKEALSGMLMRSSLVGDFPGLVVNGYNQGRLLKIMRKEKLSESVLLVIFLGIADQVVFTEPQAALQMATDAQGTILLRNTNGTDIGKKGTTRFPATGDFSQFFRASGTVTGARVLKVNAGSGSLSPSLAQALGQPTLDAATLALELVKSPDYVTFSTASTPPAHG